jgi:hypothetical protein
MRRGIIYIDENYAEFGSMPDSADNIRIIYEGQVVWGISYEKLKNHLGFDYLRGYYVIGKDANKHQFPYGREIFPYNLDRHTYNTKFAEHLFVGKQHIDSHLSFKFINELPYSFGLEFETAGGLLPQHRLYELGLIPLRDGSITGIEFSTVVLQGEQGLNLLKRQMEALDEHTIFDKDCSLHIHFGGFKLQGNVLLAVNNIFCNSDIRNYLPELTFATHMYKSNQDKNYCEFNQKYTSFAEMYNALIGRDFFGDFYQPHPKDLSGTRKWNITSRYKAVNFINALCYPNPKTIEYRILRPTYNFNKVLGWLFIFGAIIKYAELNASRTLMLYKTRISLDHILRAVYSEQLATILIDFLKMSQQIVYAQSSVKDYFGMRIDIDDKVINYQTFGHYFYTDPKKQ